MKAHRFPTRPGALQDQRQTGTDEWPTATPSPARAASIIQTPCAAHLAAKPAARRRRAAWRGFTLIELMIAIAVIGVLAGAALPSFEAQLHKARRIDALVALVQTQAAQERHRSNGGSYGTLAAIGAAPSSPAGHYALQTAASDADGYEVLATATGSQARDAACRHLKLSVSGANLVYRSGADASVANDHGANRKCWNL